MPKRRSAAPRRSPRTARAVPQVSRPLGWLLTAVSANAMATDHNIDAVAGFTTVNSTGVKTQEVVNGYTSGGVAINVFNHFVVGNGNTVNLLVPAGSSKLVNIVRSSQPEVWGTLNAYSGGALGGDVTFASSYGFLVGSSGIVNVGKLTLRTPSQSDITDFVSGNKAIGDLTGGSYTLSGSGLVSIQGKINTQSGVVIDADQVQVGSTGAIIAGNARSASYVNEAAVNTGDLTAPKTLKSDGGTISIVAKGSSGTAVDIAGKLLADGGITIEAPTVSLQSGSVLDARNTSVAKTSGDVTLTAIATDKQGYGQASATTSLTLSGEIDAANVSASASSRATSSYTEDWGSWIGMTTIGAVSGISGYAVMANANASVTVNSTANVQASGNVSLGSTARATAEDPAITLNGNSLVGAAVVYGNASSTSATQVKSGATINAGGKLSVTSHNETSLDISALTLVATNDNAAVVAVAVGGADAHSKALVETGASLTAGSVAVHADNQNAYKVSSTAYGLAGTALGVTVALGDFTSSAIADLGASVGTNAAKVGDVDVVALDRTTQQRVHSSSTVGSSVFMRTVGAGPVAALGAAQTAINNTVKSLLPTKVLGDMVQEADGTLSLRVGASFSLAQSDHQAVAHIGNNVDNASAPSIVSSGNVVVAAREDQREMRTSSESAVSARTTSGSGTARDPEVENSGSVAVNLTLGTSKAIAEVGEYTSIDATRLGVAAQQFQPIVSTYDRWGSFSDVIDHVSATAGLTGSLLTSYANASGEAEANSVSASFNYQSLDHGAKAWIGDRAKVTTSAATGGWSHAQTLSGLGSMFSDQSYQFDFGASVDVQAYQQAQSIDIAGNVGAFLILAGTGSGDDGKSLGASLSYVNYSGNAVAGVGAGATINAGAGDVSVSAQNDESHIVIAPTSGVGSGLAFNGIVGVLDLDNQTRASISNTASVTASSVDIDAQQHEGNWAAAGSFAYTDSKAVGIAVAINTADGDTRATIGDNSADAALVQRDDVATTTASGSAPTAGISTDALTVHAATDGTNASIAAAGAATSPKTGEPGYGQQFENKWNSLVSKATSAFGLASGSSSASSAGGASKSGQQASGSGSSAPEDPGFGLAASGSFSATLSDLDTEASASSATITARTTRSAIDVRALEKTAELSVAGAAAFIKAGQDPSTSSTTAFSGAVSILNSGDDAQAYLSNVSALNTGDVTVQAAQGGDRLGIGLGFSVNTNNPSGKNFSVGASASVAQVSDSASARIENSQLDAGSTSNTLEVGAYSRTDIGIGGGSLYLGGKGGVGLAITYADIGDGEHDLAEARVTGSTLTDFGHITLDATDASRIASGAAGLGGGSGTSTFNGSFVINEVGGHHTALLSGSTLTNTGAVKLGVEGGVDAAIDSQLDALGSSSEAGDYDFSGTLLSDGSQSAYGARTLGVAGFLQVGKNNLGISYVHNDVHRTGSAQILGSSVNATSVAVNAEDSAWLVSVAAGFAGSNGSLSGVGSVAVNEVNDTLSARIGDWDAASASGYVKAGSVSVTASNRADVYAGAGSVAYSKGASGGLAVALNLLGTSDHSTTAQVGWTDLYTSGSVDVSATSGTSGDMNTLVATAVGVGLAQGGLAFGGAIGVNNVDQSVDAGLRAVGMHDGTTQYRASTVTVEAHDYTENWGFGFMAAGSQGGLSAGVGIGTNRIDSDVTAQMLGGRSKVIQAADVEVDASRKNRLITVDAGVSVGTGLTGAASIGTNVTDGHVTAKIASGAQVDATNNVLVTALADTFSAVGSGSVGVGTGSASGALAVSTAVDFGVTQALVDNATVKALGQGTAATVRSGRLSNGPALSDLSDADGVDRDAVSQSFEDQALSEGTERAHGLVVNATSYEKLRTINVAGSGSTGAAAITINVATNDFEGSTKAQVTSSTINSGVSGQSGADVLVRASDHSMGLAISAGIAGASQGAGIAGLSMNLQTHDVDARIQGSTANADALKIDAAATQMAQAVSAGGSGGGTAAGAASVVVATQYGDVKAWLLGGTTTAGSVDVDAQRVQESDLAAGSASGGGQVGVGFALAVSRIGGDTRATVGRDPDDDNATTSTTVNTDALNIDAARATTIESYTFGVGVGVGVAGLAGMVNVSDQGGETRAGAYDAVLRAKDGSGAIGTLGIDAQETYTAKQVAAGAGIGFTGIGAAFNVVLSSSSTVAELVGSDTKATDTSITAEADRQAEVYSVAGGSGAFAGAVSLGFIKFGAGDAGSADSELTSSASAADTTVNKGYASNNSQLTTAEQTHLDVKSGSLALQGQVQNSAVSSTATVTGDGQTLKVDSASLLAAHVSGGKLDTGTLTVSTDGRTHTYTLAGAVQGSIAGLSGGLGITREYIVDSAIVDTQLTAHEVTVSATERDGSGGAAGEIEAFSAGGGGLVVGVAYSDVLVENRVVAGVTRAVGNDSKGLQVSARDLTTVKVGGDNEDSPENVSVGVGVVGASVSRAEKNSDVDAWAGKTGYTLDGYTDIAVDAAASGQVKATGFAVSVGVIGVMGVSSNAEDNSDVDAQLIGSVDTGSNGTVSVTASARPETYARAYGVQVAAGAAVGGSFAYATANTSANASIADSAVFSGTGTVTVTAQTGETDSSQQGGYFSADAKALAASGGLLAGLAATEVVAQNKSTTKASVGNYVTLPTGDLTVSAFNYSGQRADGDAYFGGAIIGIGTNSATAESSTSARVVMGRNPVAGVSRSGDLTLTATSTDRNEAFATGGGGGVISGSAANAFVNATDSDNAPAASVEIADWTSSRNIVGTGGLKILASHETQFYTGADTTAVSVVGGAAADATTTIDLDAKVVLGQYVGFESQAADITATNAVNQIASPSLAGWSTSVSAGAGGGINGYAAKSTINIDNQGASIALGNNASLDVFALTAHETLGNRLRLDAYSTLSIDDSAQLSTGGAIQSAVAESSVTATANNSITLGSNVSLENEVDTVQLGTYSLANVWSAANAKTYAAVGAAGGTADVTVTANNSVTLGSNAKLTGYGSVSVYAGRSADSITDNTLLLNAVSDVYNWTAAPVDTSVTADATANVNNNIDIGSGASISSVRNVWLQADEGRVYATGTGRGHNPYLELFSSEIKAGSGKTNTSSTVTFENTATVEAGTRHDQSVTIAADGSVTKGSGTEATVKDVPSFSSRSSLQSYIDELTAQKTAVDTYVATLSASDQASYTYSAAYQQIVSELSFLTPLLSELSATTVNAVYVGNITAAGGDVHLAADRVLVKAGSPSITAHGDPTITITNNSSKALIVDTLTIPNDAGGQVLVTGGASNSLPAALHVNESSNSGGSQITITHNPSATGADLFVQGDITNLGGTVTVDVEQGSLLQTANISAKEMDLTVSDIYLVNVSGMQSYGFSPLALSGYATSSRGWKPVSADEAVGWWIADRYESTIKDKGISSFNSYFYGTDYASAYGSGATVVSNIFYNWGFNDSAECSTNCTTFTFPNHAGGSDRGNGDWKFTSVGDYTGKLLLTTDYATIKNSGFLGTAVTKDALNASFIAINAGTIDVNGIIRAGNFNNWSVNIGSGFDTAIQTYIDAKGLKAGDTISITPGQPLYYDKATRTCNWFGMNCHNVLVSTAIDTGVSLMSAGDAGITLKYDVASGKLTLDDVKANGNGTVLLRGKIVSTGQDGQILVDDGLGTIRVNNASTKALVVNDLDAGSTTTGLIRITDTNYYNRTDWYVHEAGQLVQHYVTNSSAQTYNGASGSTEGYWDNGKATTSYQPMLNQWYKWTESAEVLRSYSAPPDGWYAKYLPVGNWKFANQDTPWTTSSGGIVTSCSSCGSNYLTGVFSAGSVTQDWTHVGYSYSNYYGSTFTDRYWEYKIPYDLRMSIDYYVKADNPIKLQFVGASAGTVSVASGTGITLNGTISNSAGSTSISSTGGSLANAADAVINSKTLTLSATGDIGSSQQALTAITSQINASAGGLVNLDLTAQNSSIALQQIAAAGNVTVNVDKSLLPSGSGTHLAGNNVSVTSSFGSLGDVATNQAVNISIGGQLTVATRGDINLRQASGNLTVNTIAAEAGDVTITLDNGRLLNGIDTTSRSAEETAYLSSLWNKLNMTAANAGQETVKAFENQVSAKYQQYYLIKQRLADDSDAGFAISAAYLEAMRTRVAAQQGVSGASLSDAAVTAAVKAEYSGIKTFFADNFGASQPFDSNAAYNSSWRYTVDPASALYASLTTGAQWKQSQLDIAISSAAITPVTSGYISSRAANISGNNVTLNTSLGSVGKDAADLGIAISRSNPVISADDQAALVSAGPGDLSFTTTATQLLATVKQQDPVKVNAGGKLTVTARDAVYIESDDALVLGAVKSTSGDIRLTAGGNITSSTGSATTISAGGLNIATTQGSIGTAAAPINLALTDALRVASAPGDIYVAQNGSGLALGSIGAGGFLSVSAGGALTNWASNAGSYHIVADGASLSAALGSSRYDIGTSARPVSLRLTGGSLALNGNNAYVDVTSSGAWSLGTTTLNGAYALDASGDITLAGNLSAASVHLTTDGDVLATAPVSWNTGGATLIEGAALSLADASLAGSQVTLMADAGALSAGNVTSRSGRLDLLATAGIDLYGTLTAANGLLADGQSITMHNGSVAAATGAASLSVIDAVSLTSLSASGALTVNAGSFDASGNVQTGTASIVTGAMNLSAGSVLRSTAGAIGISADALTMGSGSLLASSGATTLSVAGDLGLAKLGIGTQLNVTAGGNVAFNEAVSVGGNLSVDAGGDLSLQGALNVAGAATLRATGSGTQAAGQSTTIGQSAGIEAASWTMGAGASLHAGSLQLKTRGDQKLAQVLSDAGLVLDADGQIDLGDNVTSAGDAQLSAVQGITLAADKRLEAGGSLSSTSSSFTMGGNAELASGTGTSLTASHDVSLAQVDVGSDLVVDAGGQLSLNGALDVNGAATLQAGGDALMASGQAAHVGQALEIDAASWRMDPGASLNAGSLRVHTSGDQGLALVQTTGGLTLEAGGALALTDSVTVGGDADLNAGTDATLATLSIGGDLRIAAQRNLRFDDAAVIGGSLDVDAGRDLVLAGALDVHGAATLNAGGAGTQAAGERLHTTGLLQIDAASWTMGSGASIDARSLSLRTADDQRLAQITVAGALDLNADGDIVLRDDVAVRTDASLMAAQAIRVAGSVTVSVGGDFVSQSGSFAMDGGSAVQAGRDAAIIATSGVTLAQFDAARGLTVDAGGNVGFDETVSVGGDLALTSRGRLALSGTLDVNGAATLRVAETGAQAAAERVHVAGALDIEAASWTMGDAATLDAGSLRLKTSGDQQLALLSTAAGLQLDAGGALALGDDAVVGGHAALSAAQAITLAAGKTVNVGGDLSSQSDSLTMGAGSKVQVGGNATLATASGVTLAQVGTGHGLAIDAGGSVGFNEATTVGGDLTLTAGGDLALAGTLDVAGGATLRVTGAGTQAAAEQARVGNAFDAEAASWTMGGSASIDAGSLHIKTTGDQQLALLKAARSLQLNAGGAMALGDDATVGGDASLSAAQAVTLAASKTVNVAGDLGLQSDSFTMGAGSRARVGGNTTLVTNSGVTLAQVSAGLALTVDAGGNVGFAEATTVGSDLTLTSGGGLALIGALDVNGAATLRVAGAGTQAAGERTQVANALDIEAASWTMGDGASIDAGALRIKTSGDQQLALLKAMGSLQLDAGGAMALGDNVTVGGNASLSAAQSVTLAAAKTVNIGGDLSSQSDSLTMGAGSKAQVGGNATLATTAGMTLAQVSTGHSLTVDAGGNVGFTEATTVGGDLTLTAGGDLALVGALDVNGAATLRVVGAGTQTAGERAQVANTLDIEAAAWTMGDGASIDAGSLRLKTSGDQQLALLKTAGSLQLDAGGAMALGDNVTAGGHAALSAAQAITLAAAKTVNVGGDLNSQSDSLTMGVGSKVQVGGNVTLATTSGMTLAQVSTDQDLTIGAGGNVGFNEATTAGGDLTLTAGGDLALVGTLDVSGAATLRVTGAGTQAAAEQTRVANALDVEAASWTMGDGASIDAGSLHIKTSGDQQLALLNATGSLQLDAGGAMALGDNVTVGGNASLSAAQSVTLATAKTVNVGDDLTSQSDSLTMGAGSKVQIGGSATFATNASVTLAQANTGRGLAIDAGGSVRFNEATTVGGDLTLTSGGDLTLIGALDVAGAATLRVIGSGTQAAGEHAHVANALDIDAASWTMGDGASIDAGSLRLKTSGDQQLALLNATGSLQLDAGGAMALGDNVTVGGNASLSVAQAVKLAAAKTVNIGGDLSSQSHSLTMDAGSKVQVGGNVTLATTSGMTLAQVSTGHSLTVDAGGNVGFNEPTTVGGDLTLTAGGDLALVGTLDVSGAATLRVTGAGTQAAAEQTRVANALDIEAASWTMGDGASIDAGSLRLKTSGDQQLALLKTGAALQLDAGGAVAMGDNVAVGGNASLSAAQAITLAAMKTVNIGGDLTSQSDSLTMGAGSKVQIGGSATLATNAGMTLAQVSAGHSLAIDAGGNVGFTEATAVGGDLTLTAGGDLMLIGALDVAGAATLRVTGAGMQATGEQTHVADALDIDAASWTMGDRASIDAGSLRLKTSNDQQLALLKTGAALQLDAGGAMALGDNVTVGGNASLSAVQAITLAAMKTVNIGGDLTSQSDSLTMGAGSKVQIGGSATLATNAGMTLAQVSAGHSLAIDAGGNVGFTEATAVGGDLTLTAGGDLMLIGALDVAGAATLRVTGAGMQATGEQTHVADALDIDAASWTMGDRASIDAGSLRLKTSNDQQLALLKATGSLQLDASGAVVLGDNVTVGGNASLSAAQAITLADAKTVHVGGNLSVRSDSFTMGARSQAQVGGDATVATRSRIALAQFSTGRNLVIDAGGSVGFNEAATVGSDLALTSGGDLALVGALDVNGAATLRVTGAGAQAAGERTSVSNALDVEAASWTMGNGAAIDAGSLRIKTSGDQQLALLKSAGSLQLDAGGAMALGDDVTVGTDASLSAGQAITLAAAKTVNVRGDLGVRSDSFTMGAGSQAQIGGNAAITTTSGVTLAQFGTAQGLVIDAGGSVGFNEATAVGGDLTLTSGGDFALVGTLDVNGAATLRVTGAGTQAAAERVRVASALDVEAASWTMGNGASIDAGSLRIKTSGDQQLALLKSAGSLQLDAGGAMALRDDATVGGDATLSAAHAITLAAAKTVTVGGDLGIQSDSFAMGAGSQAQVQGDATIATTSGVALAQFSAGRNLVIDAGGNVGFNEAAAFGGDLAVTAGGSLSLVGNVDVGGAATLHSAGQGTQAAGQATRVAGALDVGAASWTMGQGSSIAAEGSMRLQAAGDVLLSSVSVHGDVLDLSAGGTLSGRNDAPVHIGTGSAGTHTTINAGLGLGDPLVVDAPWLSVATTQGDINLIVERGVYSPLLSAENGDVRLTVHGSLTFDHLLGNPWLWVDGKVSGQQMTMSQGSLNSRDALEIDQLTLKGGGPLSVAAPNIAMRIDSAGAPLTTLTLTGFDGARADNVNVSVTGTQRVEIDKLYTRNGELSLPLDVVLRDASASGALTLDTAAVKVSLDNVNPAAREADAQLITPQGSFWLQLAGTSLFTDALVTRFQSPIALYFHRPDEVAFDAQTAFYRLSTEQLSQDITWTQWRLPRVSLAPMPIFGGWLTLPDPRRGEAPAVNTTSPRSPTASHNKQDEESAEVRDDDLLIGALQ